jgi:[acyl-carrier-protein] S-malonyltransferase
MRTAVLFPGQGSETSNIRETIARLRPDLYQLALDELGGDLFDRVGESSEFAQPATFCASLAAWSRLEDKSPYALAGNSLGEFAALTAAGALEEAAGLRLVALRGRLMHRVAERRRERGMSPAFHSAAMEPAAAKFSAALERVPFRKPRVPVFSGVTAALFDNFRRRLAQAITRPVQDRETLLSLHTFGVDRFVEVGPGASLTELVERTLPAAQAETLDGERAATLS